MKNNAFLAAVEKEVQRRLKIERRILIQMCRDAAAIGAHSALEMGPKRYQQFAQDMEAALAWICSSAVDDRKNDKQMWYSKGILDRELEPIMGDLFKPWEERYS